MEIVGTGGNKRRDRGEEQGYSRIINKRENRFEERRCKAVRET